MANVSFVFDCSATLPWVFADEATTDTDRLLDELAAGEQVLVPAIWHLELGNVLLGAIRKKRIDQAGAASIFSRWADLETIVDAESSNRAWDKTLNPAQQHQLSAYDVAYLELAMRRGISLAPLDMQGIKTKAGAPLRSLLRRTAKGAE